MVGLVGLLFVLVVSFFLVVGVPYFQFGTTTRRENTTRKALESLIRDISRSQRKIVVVAESCDIEHANEKGRGELEKAAKIAHDRGVKLLLIIHHPPTKGLLHELAEANVIEIKPTTAPVPFTGRILDDKEVVRFLEKNSAQMCSPGRYIRGIAPDFAHEWENRAKAA